MNGTQRHYHTFSSCNNGLHPMNPTHRRKGAIFLFDKANGICKIICASSIILSCVWSILFMMGGAATGQAFYSYLAVKIFHDAKGGLPLVALALPILTTASVSSILYLPCTITRHRSATSISGSKNTLLKLLMKSILLIKKKFSNVFYRSGSGDVDMDRIAVLFLALPVTINLLSRIFSVLSNEQYISVQQRVQAIGNAFGVSSTIAMSFWLIPVSRHGILLHVIANCHPNRAIRLHMWCGWIASLGIILHALCHIVRWKYLLYEHLVQMFTPPLLCWELNSQGFSTMSDTIATPVCHNKETPCTCYDKFRNLSGLVAIVALAAITVTSFEWFRRKHYAIFYRIHIFMAPLFIIATALHWRKMILYLCPSLLYYAASTSPFVIQALMSYRKGGAQLESFTIIPNSGNVIELCFKASPETEVALSTGVSSLYAKLCVPSFSYIWHPFSVFTGPAVHPCKTVRILCRAKGKFTSHLRSNLGLYNSAASSRGIPLILFDGFYGGETNRVKQALAHEAVVMVAGGIGITFFLSFLPNLLAALTMKRGDASAEIPTKEVKLHWICREEGLVDHVLTHYIFPTVRSLCKSNDNFKLQIFVHHTAEKAASMEEANSESNIPKNLNFTAKITNTCNTAILGRSVSPSVMCPTWKTSRVQNIIPSLLCITTYWSGLFIIWNQFIKFKNDDRIMVQITGLSFIFGISIYALILSLSLLHWYERASMHQDCPKPVSDIELHYPSLDATSSNALSSHSSVGVECQLQSSNVIGIEENWGRPFIDDIFSYTAGRVKTTGIFICGPASLTQEVRRYFSSFSVNQGLDKKYVVYEESFCL